MVTIDLYQPGIVNETIEFPSEWNDLSLAELHIVSKSILSDFKDVAEAAAALFLGLLKFRTGKKVKDIDKRLDAEDAFINATPAVDFIYKQNNLTRQPYPTLKTGNGLMQGPADDFNSITCGEFEDSEIFFNRFREDPDADSLATLAAILYRPAGKKYLQFNIRNNEYDLYDAEALVPAFKKLKAWQLYPVFLWYAGCREQLPKIFPNCFGSTNLQVGEEDREPDPMLFTKIIHAGAGVENGSREKIRTTLLKEFFMDIELKNIANKALQAQYDE